MASATLCLDLAGIAEALHCYWPFAYLVALCRSTHSPCHRHVRPLLECPCLWSGLTSYLSSLPLPVPLLVLSSLPAWFVVWVCAAPGLSARSLFPFRSALLPPSALPPFLRLPFWSGCVGGSFLCLGWCRLAVSFCWVGCFLRVELSFLKNNYC